MNDKDIQKLLENAPCQMFQIMFRQMSAIDRFMWLGNFYKSKPSEQVKKDVEEALRRVKEWEEKN